VADVSSLMYANMRQYTYPLNMYLWPTTRSHLPHNALHPPSYCMECTWCSPVQYSASWTSCSIMELQASSIIGVHSWLCLWYI